jgi:hypothetical protein
MTPCILKDRHRLFGISDPFISVVIFVLEREVACCFVKLLPIYYVTRRHVPEESHPYRTLVFNDTHVIQVSVLHVVHPGVVASRHEPVDQEGSYFTAVVVRMLHVNSWPRLHIEPSGRPLPVAKC